MNKINFMIALFQAAILLILAPLAIGLIKKTKALLQNRQGATIFQPYWDLLKNFRKEEVISETTSWIFRAVPLICFSSILISCLLVPTISINHSLKFTGDLIALVYLLASPRFFMALAGLDAGSAFGGMGSSREVMISSTAEPALILVLFTMAVTAGTTQAEEIIRTILQKGWMTYWPGTVLAFVSLFLITLAECGRLPVDNPATHLELTMIHEAMILEYSGKSLALIEWASMTKLLLFFTLLANIFFPWGIAQETSLISLGNSMIFFILKIGLFCLLLAFIETSTAKLRLFRVPDFLGTAFVLALLALLSQSILKLGL